MKITEIFKKYNKTFSFEFFPPKDEISAMDFGINLGQLLRLSPSFVTVTYGAGGSTQERTFKIVDYVQNKIGLTCVAHYTCVNASKDKIYKDLRFLQDTGIKNLMLLRGDPPKGQNEFVALKDGFNYASELIEFTRKNFDFCIAGAGYVEKHPEAVSLDTDIANLKRKIDAGADFIITQLFFDNNKYFEFVEKCRKNNINVRIIPGIIPLTAFTQIERFTKMSGASIPEQFIKSLERNKDDKEETYKIGLDFTIKQCMNLLQQGAPGIHFYTLNKSRATVQIFESIIRG